MEELLEFSRSANSVTTTWLWLSLQVAAVLFVIAAIAIYIYDRFVQRQNQLLINYPLIGRMRYFFYLIRDPMRQYFGDEKFYESFDKVKWVYNAAEGKPLISSFSPGQPIKKGIFGLKNASRVLNREEVQNSFKVTFGPAAEHPFVASSIIGRSAMSDGAISPEGTQAFAKGAKLGGFPINTGEGGLTTNFFASHQCNPQNQTWLETRKGTLFARSVYKVVRLFLNRAIAVKLYRSLILPKKEEETFLHDERHMACFRIRWETPFEEFPREVPPDLPDIILQIGSGLYGVKDRDGDFDEARFAKVMRFCRMSEVKLAQGAKQTGGKLLAGKVSEAIAWYRGIEAHKDLFSPNRFPYYDSLEQLFDFVGRLKTISGKPAGIKIVISSKEDIEPIAALIGQRIEAGSSAYPDFLTVDGGDGGSGAAPLETMMAVGWPVREAVYVADRVLTDAGVRRHVRLIGSEKVLTPDDVVVLMALGADYVGIARGFMMSAGCIRARECSGANGQCPVGLATQDRRKRASFLVEQKSRHIANYHNRLIEGVAGLLAIMGKKSIDELSTSDLFYRDEKGNIYEDIELYFRTHLHL